MKRFHEMAEAIFLSGAKVMLKSSRGRLSKSNRLVGCCLGGREPEREMIITIKGSWVVDRPICIFVAIPFVAPLWLFLKSRLLSCTAVWQSGSNNLLRPLIIAPFFARILSGLSQIWCFCSTTFLVFSRRLWRIEEQKAKFVPSPQKIVERFKFLKFA